MKAHDKAVRRKLKLPKAEDKVNPASVIITDKWTCTCGRVHAHNVSSCVCGVSKRSVLSQQIQK